MGKNSKKSEKQVAKIQNTAVIIPIFNGESHLRELFKRILSDFPRNNLIAVNDASTDRSLEICREFGIEIINFPVNCGKGFALQKGFRLAIEKGFRYAITIDCDLQHEPELIPNFLLTQNKFGFDLVIGKRSFGKSMPLPRFLSNTITSKMLSIITATHIEDSQSGFRLYDLNSIKDLSFTSRRYQLETEIILKFLRKRKKIGFIPIPVIYDNEVSHISHPRDIFNFIVLVVKEIVYKAKQLKRRCFQLFF